VIFKKKDILSNYIMELDYSTLKETIEILSKLKSEILMNRLLEILGNNEIQKPEKHNRKQDIETSYFYIDLTEDEKDEIIDLLQDNQMNYIGDGNKPEKLFYHYSDLLDNWNV
jgi:hypothetical protein